MYRHDEGGGSGRGRRAERGSDRETDEEETEREFGRSRRVTFFGRLRDGGRQSQPGPTDGSHSNVSPSGLHCTRMEASSYEIRLGPLPPRLDRTELISVGRKYYYY